MVWIIENFWKKIYYFNLLFNLLLVIFFSEYLKADIWVIASLGPGLSRSFPPENIILACLFPLREAEEHSILLQQNLSRPSENGKVVLIASSAIVNESWLICTHHCASNNIKHQSYLVKGVTFVQQCKYTLLNFLEKHNRKAAYRKVIQQRSTVNICPVRFNHVGLPRSGKTSFRRRLTGLILNLLKAMQAGEKVQRSTGVAEEGGQVIIRDMTTDIGTIQCKAWSLLKDLLEEANMLN